MLDTDQIARDVVEPGTPALAKLVEEFGPGILDASGRLDRKRMRELVFADPAQAQGARGASRILRFAKSSLGAPQRSGWPLSNPRDSVAGRSRDVRMLTIVCSVVDAPEADQIRRLQQRDGADARNRATNSRRPSLARQRLSVADDVIVNTGTLAISAVRANAAREL